MRISDWSSDVCSSDLAPLWRTCPRGKLREESALQNIGKAVSRHGLNKHGLKDITTAYWNLDVAALYEESLKRNEGQLAEGGALVVLTGKHTGRSPKDKFIVREAATEGDIWWGDVNVAIEEARFQRLDRSEEHTSEFQSLMRISYAVFCLKKKRST